MIMDRDLLATMLPETAADLKKQAAGAQPSNVKRILLAGGMCNQPDIYGMIEQAGGGLVWDDFCTGARYFAGPVEAGGNPISRLGERLLTRIVCPAKHADLEGRGKHLVGLAKEKNAAGVIFLLFKFCDPHAFDFPYVKEHLDRAGVPLMAVEMDDSLPAGGQLKTRFEAFLEML